MQIGKGGKKKKKKKKGKRDENERGWEERRKKEGERDSIDDIYIHATARDGVPEKRGWFVTALPRSDQFPKSIEAWSVGDPWESEI